MNNPDLECGFVVTANRSFYPDVEYAKTLEEAKKIKERFIEAYKEEDGNEDCLITIAAVKETTVIKTY